MLNSLSKKFARTSRRGTRLPQLNQPCTQVKMITAAASSHPTISIRASPLLFQASNHDMSVIGTQQGRLRCYSTALASSCGCDRRCKSSICQSHVVRSNDHSTVLNNYPHNRNRSHRCYNSQNMRGKTFVSRHNQSLNVTSTAILDYCNSHNIDTNEHRTTMTHVVLRECPFCPKPTGNKPSNLYKLYIQIGGGAYFCHRCGANGSWYDFKSTVGGYSIDSLGSGNNCPPQGQPYQASPQGGNHGGSSPSIAQFSPPSLQFGGGNGDGKDYSGSSSSNSTVAPLPMPQTRLSGYYSSRLLDHQHSNNAALKYLEEVRGLTRKILRQYGVGRASYQFPSDQGGYQTAECITFPWILRTSEVEEQESLRGAVFRTESTVSSSSVKRKKTETKEAGKKDTKFEAASNDAKDTEQSAETEPLEIDKLLTRRIKVRAVENKSWQRLDPAGGGWGLFGWHTVPKDAKEIVLTEGEYDAMAVHQATGKHAVSLPNGCRSLPVQVLPLLEQFDSIYLWMDSDQPGQEGAEKFAKKLGVNRCYIVKTNDAKDANEALLKGLDLRQILEQAALMPHECILTFGDLRQDVLHELLQPQLYTGSPIPSLPGFTKLIKGFRRGEVTVLTGPTGSGKTTFLGQISLDLAEQGSNVLWGSFEIKNTRLLHKLLKQFARNPLPHHMEPNAHELLNALADRFQNLPLYFMKFHGGSEVDEVLDAMEYAVYVNDVEHIILDNMQFMISRQTNNNKFDKFDVQDMAIEKFRKFATEHNVHLTLVVHPRKEDEASKLNISSFYGSAKATQEADTVLILQHDSRRKYIDVKKNRFDGTLGFAPLYFQAASGRYAETQGECNNSSQREQIVFQPPQKKWSKIQEPEEPEPPGLDNHWGDCLGLPPQDPSS